MDDSYIYPSEEKDPRKGFLTAQGAVLGGGTGYLLKDEFRRKIESDSFNTAISDIVKGRGIKSKTIYKPQVLEKLVKHSPLVSTAGGALAGALALRTLYNISE